MLREPPAGCQEPRPGGGPRGGGAFHPRRKRQARGRGPGEGLHSGPRPQSRVARGWAEEGHSAGYSCIWGPLWPLLLASKGKTRKPGSIPYLLFCYLEQVMGWKRVTDVATWPKLALSLES